MCLFFDPKASALPQPQVTGEILIAYNVRIKLKSASSFDIQAWSTYSTQFKLICPGYDLNSLKSYELDRVNELKEWWSVRGGAPGAKGDLVRRDLSTGVDENEDGPTKSKKFALVRQLQAGKFHDIVAEVSLLPSPPILCL